uniref:SANT domain-containing protein n=1 Tax=Nelumbo nucifera TaxID=4432 RepID=A0A822YLA6_NELNU|nr:TPA_asm: hypothetical protein HUJ06_012221 [Nelumbo nucifera]
MEMDSVELYHESECTEDASPEQLHSLGSPDISDIFGDPQVLPRVGDKYQVEIPPLMAETDRLQLIKIPTDAEVMTVDVAHSFQVGQSIPIMWVHNKLNDIKSETMEFLDDLDNAINTNGSMECIKGKESQISSSNTDSNLEVEPSGIALGHGKGQNESENEKPMVVGDQMDVEFPLPQQNNSVQYHHASGKCGYPVPGSLGDHWSDIEEKSLILGLYIFGKNLVQVKRFIGGKQMGDILSFYYGKFYRSDAHRRWSECRKLRSRRCIQGQRIFTGGRQQELLSRLLMHVSEESKNTLLEYKTIIPGAFGMPLK